MAGLNDRDSGSWREAMKRWWDGKHVPPPADPLIFSVGTVQRHWTSRAAHALLDFLVREWRVLLPSGVALAGVIVAYLVAVKHFKI